MSMVDDLIAEEMQNESFAKAWKETELEDQIRRLILDARIKNNLTQKELAKKCGIRQSNISRIENGSCLPSLKTLNAIAKSLGKTIRIEII